MLLIVICRKSGDKWQSKTLFLLIFAPPSMIILKFAIATYPVWFCRRSKIFSRAVRCEIIPPFVSIGIVSSSICISTGHRESRQRLELSWNFVFHNMRSFHPLPFHSTILKPDFHLEDTKIKLEVRRQQWSGIDTMKSHTCPRISDGKVTKSQ